jgi:hypothetical protein
MGASRRRGLRGGVRALAVFTISVVTVFALATAAGAEREVKAQFKGTVKALEAECNGTFAGSKDGTLGTCAWESGNTTTCNDTKEGLNCTTEGDKTRQALQKEESRVQGLDGRSGGNGSAWTQRVKLPRPDISGVGVLEEVCSGLGGEFVAFTDATVGGCRTQDATVVCHNNERGGNCTGLADTKKHAASTRKEISAELKTTSTTTPGGSTTTTGSTKTSPTTTSPSTTTTLPPSRR